MFSSISWHQYWQFIAISSIIYYVALMIVYRQRWLARLMHGRSKSTFQSTLDRNATPLTEYTNSASSADISTLDAQMAMPNAMEAAIAEAGEGQEEEEDEDKFSDENLKHIEWITNSLSDAMAAYPPEGNKEELVLKLAQILRSDTELSDLEPFREALDWHISQQAHALCQIELLDTDINRIWKLAAPSD